MAGRGLLGTAGGLADSEISTTPYPNSSSSATGWTLPHSSVAVTTVRVGDSNLSGSLGGFSDKGGKLSSTETFTRGVTLGGAGLGTPGVGRLVTMGTMGLEGG